MQYINVFGLRLLYCDKQEIFASCFYAFHFPWKYSRLQ